uniref:Spectrin alpha, non-erythrocytic 1 n=1 Tax=Poecilia latipinna TaxID=48699 RepID=A0A3B3VVV5_9TELE
FMQAAPVRQVKSLGETAERLIQWRRLKAQMIEKRSKLGESQTLQQFSRDVDEIEAWISEKLQTATDESYKDPTNIQSKHQKHQAFEAELHANADRIKGVIDTGNALIQRGACAGSEDAVKVTGPDIRPETLDPSYSVGWFRKSSLWVLSAGAAQRSGRAVAVPRQQISREESEAEGGQQAAELQHRHQGLRLLVV